MAIFACNFQVIYVFWLEAPHSRAVNFLGNLSGIFIRPGSGFETRSDYGRQDRTSTLSYRRLNR